LITLKNSRRPCAIRGVAGGPYFHEIQQALVSSTVLVTDYAWPSLGIERAILAELDAGLLVAETGSEAELVSLAPEADAILTNWVRVPEAALEAAPRCCIVARYGVGVDNIPVERATELGILVANVPDFCLDEVSDHAIALLLACARRIVGFDRSTSAGSWNLDLAPGLPRLRGQTLGLVGYGNIARALVPKARGLGLRLLAQTPRLKEGAVDGVECTPDLDRLLAESDYVSLHAPATPDTRGLIGRRELQAMKPTAYLINTSRGSLVDEDALVEALREGWIAGAAVDVLVSEPPSPDHPLLALENAIVTPHAAFYSETAIEELQAKAAHNVAGALRGEVPDTTVNRAVLEQPNFRLPARARTAG
jgi:D-3-phosphoglycerate dehydrogenase / 2-oxoglutarate reductase